MFASLNEKSSVQLKNRFRQFAFLAAIIYLQNPAASFSQDKSRDPALTVEEVVRLHTDGFSDELIITKIKKNGKPFDLSTDELVDLKKAGLNDNIIKYLLDPSQPYSPASSATAGGLKSSGAEKKYPPDDLANSVPSEAGLYTFASKSPTPIENKTLLGKPESAGLGKMMMKKGRLTAYLVGPSAKAAVSGQKPILYLRLPEGKEMADFVLTALLQKPDLRELNTVPGQQPQIKPEAIMPFDTAEVGPKLFKLLPPSLAPGQYLLFLLGSADPSKGTFGKGYDFKVDAPPAPKKK